MRARPRLFRRSVILGSATALLVSSIALMADAGKPDCRGGKGNGKGSTQVCQAPISDTTAPIITVTSPSGGSVIAGRLDIKGTATDDVGVTVVEVQIDGGPFHPATGTSSWQFALDTTTLTDGNHSITARAFDVVGHKGITSLTITVANVVPDTVDPTVGITHPTASATVSGTITLEGIADDDQGVTRVDVKVGDAEYRAASGTSTWSYALDTTSLTDGVHTITARAVDAAGNERAASVTFTVDNSTAADGSDHLITPEGVTITVDSPGTTWTAEAIYEILKGNAIQLDLIGPHLKIVMQDVYPSQTKTSASTSFGRYTSFNATIWLRDDSGMLFAPNDGIAHEYGHVWANYHYFIVHQGSWADYLNQRWLDTDGSLRLADDARVGTKYVWMPGEIIADDYRLLFGTPASIAERPTHMNKDIIDPREQSNLRGWLLAEWAGI